MRWKCNRWISPLVAAGGLCGPVLYIAVFVVPWLKIIGASGISSHAPNLQQGIRETDRNFLDDLVRENNQDDHGAGTSLLAPDPNAVKAGAIADNLKAVPMVESVKDTVKERPKAKVVHGETASSIVRPKSDRKSLAGSEIF